MYEGIAIKAVSNGFTLSAYKNTDSWNPDTDEFVFQSWAEVVKWIENNEVVPFIEEEKTVEDATKVPNA